MLVIISTLFLLLSETTFAYTPQEGNITASFGPYFYKTDFKEAKTPASSPYLTGMGLIVNGDINDRSALEIGLFHMNKRYLRRESQSYISEQTQIIHVTMGYKRWIADYLSTSFAFYSAYPMGNTRIRYSDFAKGSEIATSARDTTEYGFDFAIQAELFHKKDYDIIADIRYSLSVTSREHEYADHYGTFIGLRYLMQEKYKDN